MESRSSIKERLFGTWDRAFNTLTIALGLLNTIVAFYTQAHQEQIPRYIVVRDVAIVTILVLLIISLLVRYLRKDSALHQIQREFDEKELRMQAALSAQLKYANNVVALATQELFDQHKTIFLRDRDIPIGEVEYEVFKDICFFVTEWVRNSIKEYLQSVNIDVKEDISVSVKLILSPEDILKLYPRRFGASREQLQKEPLWVITAYRDPTTYREHTRTGSRREVLGTLYSLDGNTAFREIYRGQGRIDRFQCNDIADLYAHRHYQNENPEWQKHYNSALVVPLVLEHTSVDKRRYLGFLAVDSLNPEHQQLYERDECYWILNHAAQVLSNYFLAQILYYDIQSDEPSGG